MKAHAKNKRVALQRLQKVKYCYCCCLFWPRGQPQHTWKFSTLSTREETWNFNMFFLSVNVYIGARTPVKLGSRLLFTRSKQQTCRLESLLLYARQPNCDRAVFDGEGLVNSLKAPWQRSWAAYFVDQRKYMAKYTLKQGFRQRQNVRCYVQIYRCDRRQQCAKF